MKRHWIRSIWLAAIAALLLTDTGCARAPQGAARGVRLVVTLRFNGPVNDNYQYFFLIRNGNDPDGQNGPIPVVRAPYQNGFATGQNAATAGFTDFVEYSRVQRQLTASGYAVYHLRDGIAGNPDRNIFEARGEPDISTPPAGSNVLQFELSVDRLRAQAGELDPTNDQRRYLQINVVATTTTPVNVQTDDPIKITDAFGDQRPGSGTFNAFLTIDTTQIGRLYQSTDPASNLQEPENDPFNVDGRYDPAVDLTYWSVRVQG